MSHDERITDMPAPLRWFLIAFKQVGFPVLVCIYLGYMHFIEGEKNRTAAGEMKEVMIALKQNIEYQTKILKRKHYDE